MVGGFFVVVGFFLSFVICKGVCGLGERTDASKTKSDEQSVVKPASFYTKVG